MTETSADNPAALTFRAATPADVADAVPLIYSSGPSAFDYVFGIGNSRGAQEFLRFAYLRRGGEFGWWAHRVAEIGGRGAAVGGPLDGRGGPRRSTAKAPLIFRFYWALLRRGVRIRRRR